MNLAQPVRIIQNPQTNYLHSIKENKENKDSE